MTQPPHIRLEVVSNPMYLSGIRDLIAAVAERLGFGSEACGHLKLAVDEAICNVIRHGYDRRPDGPIWVSLWPVQGDGGRRGVRIVIEDEARQVDPGQIRSRDLDDIRPGGLGVHIISEVMDEVSYEKRDGKGMRLTLVKWQRTDAPPGDASAPPTEGATHGRQ